MQYSKLLNNHKLSWMIFFIYIILLSMISFHHEVWRDEVVPLSIVSESKSLFEVFQKIKNYGHPGLWYSILFISHQLFSSPIVLKILNSTICVIAMGIFCLHSPFPFYQKCLFTFSLVPLYQYGAVNRNYGLCMLLLFLIALLFPKRYEKPILFSSLLFLLINTHVFGTITALAILFSIILEITFDKTARRSIHSLKELLFSFLLITIGILFFLFHVTPDSKSTLFAGSKLSFNEMTAVIVQSILNPGEVFASILGLYNIYFRSGLIILFGALLLDKFLVFVIYFTAVVGLSSFFQTFYIGHYSRYHEAFLIIIMITVLWIHANSKSSISIYSFLPSFFKKIKEFIAKIRPYLISLILIIQLILGIDAIARDIKGDYSSIKKLSQFIKENNLTDAIIICEPAFLAEALAYYNTGNQIYLYRENRFGSYINFTNESKVLTSLGDMLKSAQILQKQYQTDILFLIGIKLDHPNQKNYAQGNPFIYSQENLDNFFTNTKKIAEYWEAKSNENFDVYILENKKQEE